jgi:hypothetical protein
VIASCHKLTGGHGQITSNPDNFSVIFRYGGDGREMSPIAAQKPPRSLYFQLDAGIGSRHHPE